MHDYFDILGVSPGARVQEIRRARDRRARIGHPDVQDGTARPLDPPVATVSPADADTVDTAIDFVDMADIVERMRGAFFVNH